jgi:hypothetical protein
MHSDQHANIPEFRLVCVFVTKTKQEYFYGILLTFKNSVHSVAFFPPSLKNKIKSRINGKNCSIVYDKRIKLIEHLAVNDNSAGSNPSISQINQ